MGISVTFVLIGSNIAISLLRNAIPDKIRIAAFVVVISGFVTAVELLLKAYAPALSSSLGVFIPLIVVNCIILARAESFASKNNVFLSAVDGLAQGIGYIIVMLVMSTIREILGTGKILGFDITQYVYYEPALITILPAGGFLVLGFLIALFKKITDKEDAK
jgi:electron transport complex protein RnfE